MAKTTSSEPDIDWETTPDFNYWTVDEFPWGDVMDSDRDNSPDPNGTPAQDWADRLNANIAEPLLEGQRQIEALQQQVRELKATITGAAESIAAGSMAATERRNTLLFLRILFIAVTYIQVVHPLIMSGVKLGDRVRANASQVNPDFCQKILSPVQAPVTSEFGIRRHPISGVVKLHSGIDFGADPGTPITAPLSGKVKTIATDPKGYGNYLILDHGKGLETLYGHTSKILVTEGMSVSQGTAIAWVGSTGSSTAPHLHWETILDNKATNPDNWINTDWGTRCKK